jgi:hypothetical protein
MTVPILRPYSITDSMINECGAVGGREIVSENQNTQGKPTAVPLYPPQSKASD